MIDYKDSKWAHEIIELQKDDGSWGYFHTLSNPSKRLYGDFKYWVTQLTINL
jgi:hypothetical protein